MTTSRVRGLRASDATYAVGSGVSKAHQKNGASAACPTISLNLERGQRRRLHDALAMITRDAHLDVDAAMKAAG